MRIDGKNKAPWLKCRGCRKVYWAETWHCTQCHETFAQKKPTGHLQHGVCVPMHRLGWSVDKEGVWQPPEPKKK